MTSKTQPVQLLSGLTAIVVDWLVYATTMSASGWSADVWYVAAVVGAAAALVVVTLLESRAGLTLPQAFVRALVAAVAIAVPLPVLGTVVGLAGIVWAGTNSRGQASS